MPRYTEFNDLSGEFLYDRFRVGARMRVEREFKGFKNADAFAEIMRSRHHVAISGRQYLDMENGKNAKGNPVHLRLDVLIAYVDIVNPPRGMAFIRDDLSPIACRVLGISKED